MRLAWLIVIVASVPACLRQTAFHCETNAECGTGRCEQPQGFCSVVDPACGGYRFDESAGSYANQCVDAPGADSGAGCPAGYDELPGGSAHRYKVLTVSDDWMSQRDACSATSPNTYLTIPDDQAELQALSTLAGASEFWVGIDDLDIEDVFVTVLGTPATFLPWQPDSPNPSTAGGQDCVEALSATSQFNDKRCSSRLRAICECAP